jgi:hypothetical protein
MPDPLHVGDHCHGDHGNAGPCTFDGEKWVRDDGAKACPFDQSN